MRIGAGVLSLLLLAGAAEAETCFGATGPAPRKVTFQNESVVTILSRKGDVVRYASGTGAAGRVDTAAHLTLYPLKTVAQGTTTAYVWSSALPSLADLRPGVRLRHAAVMRVSGKPDQRMVIDLQVTGRDVLVLGACRYPVLRIKTLTSVDGMVVATVYRDLDPVTLLVLQTAVEMPDGAVQGFSAARIE